MHSIKDLISVYLEKIKTAEIEPGFILMVLIWLFSSFFSKKKPKKSHQLKDKVKVSQKFENILAKLGELPDMDINNSQKVNSDFEEILYDENSELRSVNTNNQYLSVEDETPIDLTSNQNDLDKETNFYTKPKPKPKKIKLYGTSLQKVIVLKEILDKPRALRPISFTSYNDT